MKAHREKRTEEYYINWWLDKFHNTSIEQILKERPEWNDGNHSREFYKTYAVTQEQYDEFDEWFIKTVMKEYRMSKRAARREFAMARLNIDPSVTNIE